MPPRTLLAALEDAAQRREPSLTEHAPAASPRLVSPRTGLRAASPFELHAGERVVVSSAPEGSRSGLVKIAALAVVGVLALIGVAALVRPFVGL
ncbi:MAG TPA: hypothetical protein VN802_06985 [Stellaceae bacterium]|nr:hypothetical protein [Stellaceae bacterium]